ncbi:hypothetical protein BGX29_009927 [Mortierella sp. GBA35]|nr:hypothetical protein BGX29_009927 [Mortierella sp. GBA35]
MADLSQSFRHGLDGKVFKLEVSLDSDTKQQVIHWDDIIHVFPRARLIKNGDIFVTFVRNVQREGCEPRRIRYYHGVVLEVIEDEGSGPKPPSVPQASGLLGLSNFSPIALGRLVPGESAAVEGRILRPNPKTMSVQQIAIASSISLATAVSTSNEKTTPPPPPHRLLQRTQSILQETSARFIQFERYIQAGQTVQVEAILHWMQVQHQELQRSIGSLHSEVTKNKELQQQILDMQEEAKVLARQMDDLQKQSVDMQKQSIVLHKDSIKMHQESLDCLDFIKDKLAAIMNQSYKLHEYPIPRLFIVLRNNDTTMTERLGRGLNNLFAKQFRLYFLCECGDHTKPTDGKSSNPNLKHEIHIARHEGYTFERPTEFFNKYGSYILTLLQMLKYGVTIAGVLVPPLTHFNLTGDLDDSTDALNGLLRDIGPLVDNSIACIEDLISVQGLSSSDSTLSSTDSATLGGLKTFEGADLRQLHSFLRTNDKGKALGNLYRTVTAEGHVKWVCLDHYRENYRPKPAKVLRDAIQEVGGEYDESTGRMFVALSSPREAKKFYSVLSKSRSVQELILSLKWNATLRDLDKLRDAIMSTNIFCIDLWNSAPMEGAQLSAPINKAGSSDPILQMMSYSNIQSVSLHGWNGFLDHISDIPTKLHVRRLEFRTTENWSEGIHRLGSIVVASPFLSELSLSLKEYSLDVVVDPIASKLEGVKRSQALRMELQNWNDCRATVEFEASTGKISFVSIRVKGLKETRLLDHPSVRNIDIQGQHELPLLLDQFRRCLRDNTRLESIRIKSSTATFIDWLEEFQQLLAQYPQQTPQFCLFDKWTRLTTINIQVPDATTLDLVYISNMELSEGYLDTVPDCCSFKTEVLYLGNDTTLLAVKALAEFMKKRPGQLLFSVLSLRLDEKTDPDIFPALLDVLQEYTVSQNATVVLRVDDLGGSGLLADPNGHDSVKRIVQDHTSTVVFSYPGKSSAPIDIFDGPFRRLQKIYVSDLDHPTEHMVSWILSMVKRVDGDDTNTDSLSQPPATTTDYSPNRLRLLSFYKCQMYDA